jgi:hypothetical protein
MTPQNLLLYPGPPIIPNFRPLLNPVLFLDGGLLPGNSLLVILYRSPVGLDVHLVLGWAHSQLQKALWYKHCMGDGIRRA